MKQNKTPLLPLGTDNNFFVLLKNAREQHEVTMPFSSVLSFTAFEKCDIFLQKKNQLCNLTTCSNKTSEAMGKHTYTQQVASHHLHMKTISHTKGNKQKLENPARFSSIHKAENK